MPTRRMRTRTAPLERFLTRPVAFYPCLAQVCGSATAGLLLSQVLYWSDRTENGSGWFYKTSQEWLSEIALTRNEQVTARKILKALGILREKRQGLPAKMHYFIDIGVLSERLAQSSTSHCSRLLKTTKQESPKDKYTVSVQLADVVPDNKTTEKEQTFLTDTESTAETTSVSTPVGAALRFWCRLKNDLRSELGPDEWRLWVRPALFLTLMSGTQLLIALPPNGRIIDAASQRKPLLSERAGNGGYGISFTRYPDEYEREQVRERYPEFYGQLMGNRIGSGARRVGRQADVPNTANGKTM